MPIPLAVVREQASLSSLQDERHRPVSTSDCKKRFQGLVVQQAALGESRFLLQYEEAIVETLVGCQRQVSERAVRTLSNWLYHAIWKKRLTAFAGREWLLNATVDELVRARDSNRRFLALVVQIPPLEQLIGTARVCRHRANAKALEARLYQKWKNAAETIRLYDEAADELERIPAPSLLDLANVGGNRARSAEARAFSRLRQRRPASDLKGGLDDLRVAAQHARRGEILLRSGGVDVSSQYGWYLRYWRHVVAMEQAAVDRRFRAAGRHMQMAVLYAERLPTFPTQKWYASVTDLQRQHIVLAAYEALLARRDVAEATRQLDEWLKSSGEIATTGRYQRLLVRKLAMNGLLASKDVPSKARSAAAQLERLIASKRSFGRSEIYVRETINALIARQIDYELALDRVSSVFVLDSRPPEFGYVDARTEDERCFASLPAFLWDWLVDVDADELRPDEISYVFLLYSRSVAEFWASVYVKRVSESRVPRVIDCEVPNDFAKTDWDDLGRLVGALAAVFDTEPALAKLATTLSSFRADQAREDGTTGMKLRDYVKGVIRSTERRLFPHPVLVEGIEQLRRGRVRLVLKRAWRASTARLRLTLLPRSGQQLRVGSYYFLKPSYKRIERDTDTEDLVLHPLRPSTGFGEPPERSALLLVEGDDDRTVFEAVLKRFNPHWRARVEVVVGGGAQNLVRRYQDLAKSAAVGHVVVVLDQAGGADALVDIRRMGGTSFALNPDLEGAQPEALRLALGVVAPEVALDRAGMAVIVDRARLDGRSTLACLKDFREANGIPRGAAFADRERVKRELASIIAEKVIELGPCEQVVAPVSEVLRLAFGHA